MNKGTLLVLTLAGIFLITGALYAKETTPQKTCPVMGNKINKDVHTDHDGKRIYFCCPGCINKFEKNPEKHIDKLEKKGYTLAKLQTKCPVSGGDIKKKAYLDHNGKRVYFCGTKCACSKKFKKNPEKYTKELKEKGYVLEDAPKEKK